MLHFSSEDRSIKIENQNCFSFLPGLLKNFFLHLIFYSNRSFNSALSRSLILPNTLMNPKSSHLTQPSFLLTFACSQCLCVLVFLVSSSLAQFLSELCSPVMYHHPKHNCHNLQIIEQLRKKIRQM